LVVVVVAVVVATISTPTSTSGSNTYSRATWKHAGRAERAAGKTEQEA
jgi:hypothetical protein